VINSCFGGFGLSDAALEWLIKNKGWKVTDYNEEGNCVDDTARIVNLHSNKTWPKRWQKYGLNLSSREEIRPDPDLIEVVEKLGKKANAIYAFLEIIEIPDDVEWEIEEYDGNEWVSEKHRRWPSE